MGITKTNTNSSIIMTRIITGTIRVNMFEVIIRYTVIVHWMLLDIGSGLVSYRMILVTCKLTRLRGVRYSMMDLDFCILLEHLCHSSLPLLLRCSRSAYLFTQMFARDE